MAEELSILMRLRGARRVNAELAGTASAVAKIDRAAARSTRNIGALGRSMQRTGALLTRRLSIPVAAAGGIATKMAFDYEESMTRVRTLTEASTTQVDRWSKQIMGLSKETAVAPRELAEALYFLASSGLPLNQVMSALEITAKGTALGLGETETIAQLVTSAMNAYSKSGLTAADAMDVLIAGTKAGKLEASDLASVLGRVLPLASRLGVPLEGVVAAMEGMSMAGADAEQAGVQVSAFLSQLIRPRPAGIKALRAVGLTYEGLLDQLRDPKVGLLGVIKLLDRAFNGDIIAQGKVFTNVRALRTQLGLTGDMGKRVDEVFRQTMDSAGATGEAWAKLGQSDAFKLRKGIVAIQVAAIRLGEMIAPTVVRIAHGFERFTNMAGGAGGKIVILMLALIALGPVLSATGFGVQVFRGALMMLRGATFGATVAAVGLNAALLASPITWIVLGLAAVAIGFYLLYTRVEGFRNAMQNVWNWVKSHWRLLAVLGFPGVGLAIVMVVNHFKTLKRWLVTIFNWAKRVGDKLGSLAGPFDKVRGAAGAVGGGLSKGADWAEGVLGGRALGGPIRTSGKYLVGERGPEIVRLPAGAHVTPNSEIGRELVTAPIIVRLDGRTVAESTARVVADRKARK